VTAGAKATVDASIAGTERQEITVTGDQAVLSLASPAFTTWREPSSLTIRHATGSTTETFPTTDAYQLMIEAVVDRVRGGSAWLVDRTESLEVAALVDAVREHASGHEPTES
jgi:hypothetical protein